MSERGQNPPRVRLTRRQLRDAGGLRAADDEQVTTATEPSAAVHSAAIPSRRALREAATAPDGERGRPVRTKPLAWLPRATVLGCLAVGMIAIPLGGVTASDVPAHAPSAPVDTASTSVLEEIDAAAARYALDSAHATAALRAEVAAPNRALVQTSRDIDREELACADATAEGANGIRTAMSTDAVVHPLAAGSFRQSSRYGSRVHPIFGGESMHTGTDLAAPMGTPIMAVADGVVRHAGAGIDGRSSMLVIIDHEVDGETFSSWYVHMYPDGVFVDEGDQVRAGETIGAVGSNGNSTGPHLHLEIHLDAAGTTTDPGAFLADRDATFLEAGACA